MMPRISERSFEAAIERALLANGADAYPGDSTVIREVEEPYGEAVPGGYHKRQPEQYDRALCLIPRDVVDFILATQPKEWQKLKQHHGAAVEGQFLRRLSSEIGRRGALDVLRHGIKDSGCKFQLAYFRPASGLNADTRRLYQRQEPESCAGRRVTRRGGAGRCRRREPRGGVGTNHP
jgi:type I restriction enzyme R subunit